jgi:UDP-3-O-[3-hydroxymyristoyl] glucosamine N-acyltransferase
VLQKSYSLQQIADYVQADIIGDASVRIEGLAPLETATNAQLSFIDSEKAFNNANNSHALAFVVPPGEYDATRANYLVVTNPRFAFAKAGELFDHKAARNQGIHPSAVIADSANVAATAIIGAHVTIGHDCIIGDNTRIKANAVIADNVEIGANCIIHEGAVIGSDGFGNANDKGKWYKIPQLGGVRIADNVEIGANSTIDCGAMGNTIIGEGVRLDNLVHIAHNVEIGAHTAIAAQVAVAGSTKIGKHCIFAGQCGVNGHITICDGAIFTGKAAVTKSVTEPGIYSSNTGLMENSKWRKMVVRLRQLDDLAKVVKKLEKLFVKEKA